MLIAVGGMYMYLYAFSIINYLFFEIYHLDML